VSNTDDNNGTGEIKTSRRSRRFNASRSWRCGARALVPATLTVLPDCQRRCASRDGAPTLESTPKAMVADPAWPGSRSDAHEALQSIAVINGKPDIWGDAPPGPLIYASGRWNGSRKSLRVWGNDNYTRVAVSCGLAEAKRSWSASLNRRCQDGEGSGKAAGAMGRTRLDHITEAHGEMRASGCSRDAFADVLKACTCRESRGYREPMAAESPPVTRRAPAPRRGGQVA